MLYHCTLLWSPVQHSVLINEDLQIQHNEYVELNCILGSGVSSSAAVEVAAMTAFAAALRLDVPPRRLALLCQMVRGALEYFLHLRICPADFQPISAPAGRAQPFSSALEDLFQPCACAGGSRADCASTNARHSCSDSCILHLGNRTEQHSIRFARLGWGPFLTGVFNLQVENRVVGAPCGVMDQMAAALGRRRRLLALACTPAQLQPPVALPANLRLWGVDSGAQLETHFPCQWTCLAMASPAFDVSTLL